MRAQTLVSRVAASSLFLFTLTVGLAVASKSAAKIDLNSASEKELEALPGVGKATAAKIVSNRPYSSVDDLSKAGLSAKTIDKLRSQVTVGSRSSARAATKESKAADTKKPEKTSKSAEGTKKSEKKTAAASSAPASGTKVDINTASQKELEALPGVGSKTAEKIIAKRPYSSLGDLSRAGVSKKTMEKIAPLVTVSEKRSRPASAPASTSASTPPGAPSPATRAESVPAESRSKSASRSTSESSASTAPYQAPPSRGMVWVNLDTKIYHREGDHWYGKTVHGKYMTEAEAQQAGYRLSKEKGEPK